MESESALFTLQSGVSVFVVNIRFLRLAARAFVPFAHLHPAPGSTPGWGGAGPSKGEGPSPGAPSTATISVCAGQIPGTTSALVRNWKRPSDQSEDQGQGPSTEPPPRARAFLAEVKQVRARRKTAKMLMVVLLVFALCYLPISVLNVLKR